MAPLWSLGGCTGRRQVFHDSVVATALVVSSVVVVITASAVYISVKLECVTQSALLHCLKRSCSTLFCFFVIVFLFSCRSTSMYSLTVRARDTTLTVWTKWNGARSSYRRSRPNSTGTSSSKLPHDVVNFLVTSSRPCWRRRQLPRNKSARKLRGSSRQLVRSF